MDNRLLEQLAKEFKESGAVEISGPGKGVLFANEGLEVNLLWNMSAPKPTITFSVYLGACPPGEEILEKLLGANMIGSGSSEIVLALDESSGQVKLSQHVSAEIQYPEFHEILENFVNTALFWAMQLTKYQPSTAILTIAKRKSSL